MHALTKTISTFLIFCLWSASQAKTIPVAEAKSLLLKTLNKYSTKEAIVLDIERLDDKVALGTTASSKGVLKYSKNKLYIELNADTKSELFYKNKKVTLVEYPDKDFDENGNRKVTILTKNSPAVVSSFINLFSNPKKFIQDFKITSTDKIEKEAIKINFKPKNSSIEHLGLVLNIKTQTVEKVEFIDDVKTKTEINVVKTTFQKHLPNKTFDYKQEKTDQVHTE